VLSDVGEALLAVEEGADERVESELHFVLTAGICRHGILNLGEMWSVGQGPSAVRDSPPPTASKRNRENPAPLPTGSKDRRVKFGSAADIKR
jgi:hypothetical protein